MVTYPENVQRNRWLGILDLILRTGNGVLEGPPGPPVVGGGCDSIQNGGQIRINPPPPRGDLVAPLHYSSCQRQKSPHHSSISTQLYFTWNTRGAEYAFCHIQLIFLFVCRTCKCPQKCEIRTITDFLKFTNILLTTLAPARVIHLLYTYHT